MTLNISDNNWAKAGLALLGLVAVVGVWVYLAGGIFLMAFDQKFDDATPLTLYQYWYHYGTEPAVERWIYIAGGIALALLLAPFAIFFAPAKRSLFGDARFATRSDVKRAGLLGEKGLIVGRLSNRYLMFAGQEHAIISAPTRSGKGVGIVIPNLLNWPDSVVVLDIKQENWDITAGFRRKYGQECYLFNPTAADYRTHRYNPLAYISPDPHFRIDDIQKIGNMLFPDLQGIDPIWTATPRAVFLGIVLYLLETPDKPVTLGQVLRETLTDGDGSAYFARIINERAASGVPLSPSCVRGLNSYISISSDNTRAGIMTSFRSRLELWMNPLVDAATSGNDFDLRDVRKRRLSIYLGVTPDNLERMAPLLNLFFQQLIDLNVRELPEQNPAIKHPCLLLMDEFTAMGKIPVLSKGISFIAGYWLRMMPIIQSPAQIADVYGEKAAETFQTNHALNIVYPPKASETKTAREISEWLGYQTVKGKSLSKGKNLFGKKTPTENTSDQRRALLLPQEITSLGKGRELVIMEHVPPILARRVEYYKDPEFVDRLKQVAPSLRALGKKTPTQEQWQEAIRRGELSAPVPMLDLTAHDNEVGDGASLTVAVSHEAGPQRITIERPATAGDVPKLSTRCLADFAVDFSAVDKPRSGELDEAALHVYADNLCKQAGIRI